MKTQVLIDNVVQQTMVFIAQLATAGGVRAPLAHVANQVFLDLTSELQNQGVKKKIIADMFGMALRSYHRRVRELSSSRTDGGRTLWEAVLEFLREREPVRGRDIHERFRHDDEEILRGVLNDLVSSGFAYRSGRGDDAVYRLVDERDFGETSDNETHQYLVWLSVYRNGPLTLAQLAEQSRLSTAACEAALKILLEDGRVRESERGEQKLYTSPEFSVPLGTSQGWEAAVLDHFQAMVAAIGAKLRVASRSRADDTVGGSTWSLDVWSGHPLELEALKTLRRVRAEMEDLRRRVDAHNAAHSVGGERKRVVFYMGQYVRLESDDADAGGEEA
ncbi:MAG: DNA glycosylase AlkZ-like family protein [Myxococcota bacterium]